MNKGQSKKTELNKEGPFL